MKLKDLESALECVENFENPKINLEQYQTRPHVAARVIHTIENNYNDFDGKLVADLGCGTGSLLIGAALMGSSLCIGYDIDPDAMLMCQYNINELEVEENVELLLQDVTCLCDIEKSSKFYKKFDTVISNPPFGTKNNKGMDMKFLKAAMNLSKNSIYSFHKTSTRQHISKKALEWKLKAETIAELRFDIPASYKFHKLKCVDVEVDLWRFCF